MPVKTSLGRKVRIKISHEDDDGFWLDPDDPDPNIAENDYETDFALIP